MLIKEQMSDCFYSIINEHKTIVFNFLFNYYSCILCCVGEYDNGFVSRRVENLSPGKVDELAI